MFEESVLHEDTRHYCRAKGSFKCKGSSDEWVESLGLGGNCREAEADMFEMVNDFCIRAEQADPIFRTIDWSCSCDRK
jgi:hypothetical protein